jgi:hypothetical protein
METTDPRTMSRGCLDPFLLLKRAFCVRKRGDVLVFGETETETGIVVVVGLFCLGCECVELAIVEFCRLVSKMIRDVYLCVSIVCHGHGANHHHCRREV